MSDQVIHKPNYLQILNDAGALAFMQNDLTLIKNKPPFNEPRLQFIKSASELVVEVCRIKCVSWNELCASLPWQMSQDIIRKVGGNSTSNFEALVNRLCDYVGLSTDFNTWVAACTVPGRGTLYRQNGESTRLWLLGIKNNHPERLQTLGAVLRANEPETTAILATIRDMGFAALFALDGQVNINAHQVASIFGNGQIVNNRDAMDLSPPDEAPWQAILRSKLNPVYISSLRTNQAKNNRIDAVLSVPATNAYIRQRVPWLLPDNSTLLDLLNHVEGTAWAELVAILVEVAERALGKVDTTFPNINTRQSLRLAVQRCQEQTPFLEMIMYSPSLLPKDRKLEWRIVADTVMEPHELILWLRLPPEMANEQLSKREMLDHFDELNKELDNNAQLRATVFNLVRQRRPSWKFTQFETIENTLFAVNPPAVAPVNDFVVPSKWPGAKTFLAKLGIVNPVLEANLDKCEANGYFDEWPKEEWRGQLAGLGSLGIQTFDVYSALVKANLIK